MFLTIFVLFLLHLAFGEVRLCLCQSATSGGTCCFALRTDGICATLPIRCNGLGTNNYYYTSTDDGYLTVFTDSNCPTTARIGTYVLSLQSQCRTITLLDGDLFSYRENAPAQGGSSSGTPPTFPAAGGVVNAPASDESGGMTKSASLLLAVVVPIILLIALSLIIVLGTTLWASQGKYGAPLQPPPPPPPPPPLYDGGYDDPMYPPDGAQYGGYRGGDGGMPEVQVQRVAVPVPVSPYANSREIGTFETTLGSAYKGLPGGSSYDPY